MHGLHAVCHMRHAPGSDGQKPACADSSTLPDELARVLTHMRDLDETAVKLQGDIHAAVRDKVGAAAQKVLYTGGMVVHAQCPASLPLIHIPILIWTAHLGCPACITRLSEGAQADPITRPETEAL